MSASVTVTLKAPVQAHGETVEAITLRPPRGDDIIACGYPFQVMSDAEAGAGAIPIAGAVAKYIARLGNVPPSTVRALSAPDWNACMQAVGNFFVE